MSAADLGKMVPGFDFLQGLMKTAGSTLPSFGQWVAPTLDPEELDKRISELRTVQFWLEQNARMIASTVQALEVQRMTLSTLKTMNVSMGELTEAFKLKVPEASPPPEAPVPAAEPAPAPAPRKRSAGAKSAAAAASAPMPGGLVDPMQWWGALTQQFTEIAAKAAKDGSIEAATGLAGELGRQAAAVADKAMQAVAPVVPAAAKKPRKAAAAPTTRAAARRR